MFLAFPRPHLTLQFFHVSVLLILDLFVAVPHKGPNILKLESVSKDSISASKEDLQMTKSLCSDCSRSIWFSLLPPEACILQAVYILMGCTCCQPARAEVWGCNEKSEDSSQEAGRDVLNPSDCLFEKNVGLHLLLLYSNAKPRCLIRLDGSIDEEPATFEKLLIIRDYGMVMVKSKPTANARDEVRNILDAASWSQIHIAWTFINSTMQ